MTPRPGFAILEGANQTKGAKGMSDSCIPPTIIFAGDAVIGGLGVKFGYLIWINSMNSAVMTVFATHAASFGCSGRSMIRRSPSIKDSRRGWVSCSITLSHSLLHFLHTALTFLVPACPDRCVLATCGGDKMSPSPAAQLTTPWVCVSEGERGKSLRSQFGNTCSREREAPEAPSQKTHFPRPLR